MFVIALASIVVAGCGLRGQDSEAFTLSSAPGVGPAVGAPVAYERAVAESVGLEQGMLPDGSETVVVPFEERLFWTDFSAADLEDSAIAQVLIDYGVFVEAHQSALLLGGDSVDVLSKVTSASSVIDTVSEYALTDTVASFIDSFRLQAHPLALSGDKDTVIVYDCLEISTWTDLYGQAFVMFVEQMVTLERQSDGRWVVVDLLVLHDGVFNEEPGCTPPAYADPVEEAAAAFLIEHELLMNEPRGSFDGIDAVSSPEVSLAVAEEVARLNAVDGYLPQPLEYSFLPIGSVSEAWDASFVVASCTYLPWGLSLVSVVDDSPIPVADGGFSMEPISMYQNLFVDVELDPQGQPFAYVSEVEAPEYYDDADCGVDQ